MISTYKTGFHSAKRRKAFCEMKRWLSTTAKPRQSWLLPEQILQSETAMRHWRDFAPPLSLSGWLLLY